jgi:cell division control protein 24
MVETERKYVQDLEVMQKYATALSQSNTIDQDTIHLLFPGLNKLLNFQRKFLIRVESTAEMPWKDQRWGLLFLENEDEFAVYEPYCANYTNAADIMIKEEQNLSVHNNLINAKSELPAFLIKPVQRICKYPLLLDSLVKASTIVDYPYYEELQAGSATAKRITDKINEAQRRAENNQTVRNLEGRVKDWKGHHLSNFGNLLLDDIFTVTKSEVDREYHVFLFEKIILCCKEALQPPPSGKRGGKNNSILKKQPAPSAGSVPGVPNKKKDTPLLLKGRIFLNNVTQAIPSSPRNSIGSSSVSPYSLAVWWRGDDDLEYFTLRCRSEEQLKQWETQINRLIREVASRRASDRNISQFVAHNSHASIPPSITQRSPLPYSHDRASSSMSHSQYINSLPPHPASGRHRPSPYSSEEQFSVASSSGSYSSGGYRGYVSADGFEFDLDDEYEDYPPSSIPSSGRGTPLGTHRLTGQNLYSDRESFAGYDHSRARTEDTNGHIHTQWRSVNGTQPFPGSLVPSYRPPVTRMSSTTSATNTSFGSGSRPPRIPLHTQISSQKLKTPYDQPDTPTSISSAPITYPLSRSRSASQPSAYVPQTSLPPVPTTSWNHHSQSSTVENKRGSGSSQSTRGSSEESPNSSSPITPFGSSESSLAGPGLRQSRSQTFESMALNTGHPPSVKVKVHFQEDIFVIQVPRSTEFGELVDKVGRKIRLCGPRRDDTPLRVKYKDEDGDLISLGSTEDVQMAFESFRPGGQVTLYVT